MSYILEALKKAQAERQLGALPTIHAPTLQNAAAAPARPRWPWLLALGLMAAIVAGLLLLLLRQPAPVDGAAPVVKAPAGPALPAAMPASLAVAAAPAITAASPPAPAPSVAPSAPLAPPLAQPQPQPQPTPREAARPVAAPPRARAEPPAQEEVIQTLQELPEPIQRAIPTLALGGYIYSKNPADRLLLVDKVLRHEGDELAPGLVLEKLLPKAAVFSFKGYRYRVPY